jgi:hypothetical protein
MGIRPESLAGWPLTPFVSPMRSCREHHHRRVPWRMTESGWRPHRKQRCSVMGVWNEQSCALCWIRAWRIARVRSKLDPGAKGGGSYGNDARQAGKADPAPRARMVT